MYATAAGQRAALAREPRLFAPPPVTGYNMNPTIKLDELQDHADEQWKSGNARVLTKRMVRRMELESDPASYTTYTNASSANQFKHDPQTLKRLEALERRLGPVPEISSQHPPPYAAPSPSLAPAPAAPLPLPTGAADPLPALPPPPTAAAPPPPAAAALPPPAAEIPPLPATGMPPPPPPLVFPTADHRLPAPPAPPNYYINYNQTNEAPEIRQRSAASRRSQTPKSRARSTRTASHRSKSSQDAASNGIGQAVIVQRRGGSSSSSSVADTRRGQAFAPASPPRRTVNPPLPPPRPAAAFAGDFGGAPPCCHSYPGYCPYRARGGDEDENFPPQPAAALRSNFPIRLVVHSCRCSPGRCVCGQRTASCCPA